MDYVVLKEIQNINSLTDAAAREEEKRKLCCWRVHKLLVHKDKQLNRLALNVRRSTKKHCIVN